MCTPAPKTRSQLSSGAAFAASHTRYT